ncbi:polysaccharide pyruvyl transferase family protein [Aliarcobacter cryaerophilus]|uniref:polysaccharide pyruvyl transferase family protein n=1 Tax=Aliarcobacter cryaerophilus TaxID=28198 RepID=UPI0021B1A73D|nr:polysaccharide pyruvyl transferase family protein [Aliarcobacter cryaerophilus]MCT7484582.1 polysaccharide pyruvyl transferase family protein [Aliarcobacter cryaerophilus]
MKKVNILHIASFTGNIGDNASHIGFYSILDSLINYSITKLEMRKFYKNYKQKDKQYFDKNFIDYLNNFDICFIGGGGFLDYHINDSKTGTTIDIDSSLIKYIKIPTYLVSMGSNPHKEIPLGNMDKYKLFLEEINKNPNIKIALRNDGSIDSIKNDLGSKYIENIEEILDHGFFFDLTETYPRIINNKYIAINITSDQIGMKSKLRKNMTMDSYYFELKKIVDYIIDYLNLDVVFIPHIYSDLNAILELFKIIDDSKIRNNISVAPLLQSDEGANKLFNIYKQSEQVIATRFHANICSLVMDKKTIGLVVLDRIEYLHKSLGLEQSTVIIQDNFSKRVIELLEEEKMDCTNILLEKKDKTLNFYKKVLDKGNI